MDNDRSAILSQLANGQITADQAAAQLRGAGAPPEPPELPPGQNPQPQTQTQTANRWLRVRISDLHDGRQRVAVNLPLNLVGLGLRIGARFSPEVAGLDPNEILEALRSGQIGQIVDVEDLDDGQRVQVFIE
jgi:hypothetical protein